MKINRIFIIVAFCLSTFPALAPVVVFAQSPLVSKWEKVGPVNFTALVHQSPSRIVATTDHGYLYFTDDDGTTWQRSEVSDTLDLEAISFGDSLHGMMLSLNNSYMPYSEYRLVVTTDGGANWDIRPSPVFSATCVACLGADTAFLVDYVGDIYRSTDGGSSWVEKFTVDTANGNWKFIPNKMKFLDQEHGYVLASWGWIEETSDAGEHWTSRALNSTASLLDIDFYNQDIGVIGATGAYLVTTDGGANWAVHTMPHDETDNDFTTVGFFNAQSFFAFGDINGILYSSTDLGATITPLPFWEANSIHTVVRTSSGGWLATGSFATILHAASPPEGTTSLDWTVLDECPFGTDVSLHASNGSMLQCVAGSYPLISTDSGILWHVTDTHFPSYGAIHFPSADTGYLFYTGSNPSVYGGVNLMTVDSGQSWKQIDMTGYIQGATFGSADTGYGFLGSLVRTTDGGINWLPDSIPFPIESPYPGYKIYRTSMISIASPDGHDAFVTVRVSDTLIVQPGKEYYDNEKFHFAVYKTSDGGATWTGLKNIPTLEPSPGIYFQNASLGFLTCDSGRIYRTSDGGNTWDMEQLAPFQYSFNSINFLTDRIGFLTLDSQAVLQTIDAGLTWTWLLVPTNRDEIFADQIDFIDGKDTVANQSGMSTEGVFFPDSTTVLISFVRRLLNINPSPDDTVINGDTIIEITPVDEGEHVYDYGFYRGKLNIPPASVVDEQAGANPSALSISSYPNPAREDMRVRISSPDEAVANVEVLDILGRIVIQSRMGTNLDFSLDLHSLPNGIYSLRCESGNQSTNRIFTIEK